MNFLPDFNYDVVSDGQAFELASALYDELEKKSIIESFISWPAFYKLTQRLHDFTFTQKDMAHWASLYILSGIICDVYEKQSDKQAVIDTLHQYISNPNSLELLKYLNVFTTNHRVYHYLPMIEELKAVSKKKLVRLYALLLLAFPVHVFL